MTSVLLNKLYKKRLKLFDCFVNLQEYFEFPPSVPEISDKAHSFIAGLICERDVRLGRKGLSDFRSHPFFSGINWGSMHKLPAPFIPEVSNPTDTSNFDIVDDCLSDMVLALQLSDDYLYTDF